MTAPGYLLCLRIVGVCCFSLYLLSQVGHAEEFTTFGTIPHPDGVKGGFQKIYELRNGSTFRLRGRIDTDALWLGTCRSLCVP